MTYYDQLCRAMELVAEQPRAIVLGQTVLYPGTGMYASFANVPQEKKLETPVFEQNQLGVSIGLAIEGMLPLSVFPRWNFLLEATGMLVTHLDAIPRYSDYRPKVIIRVAVGYREPLDPGPQHLGDFSAAFRLMLKRTHIIQLKTAKFIVDYYREAIEYEHSTVLVEYPELYNES